MERPELENRLQDAHLEIIMLRQQLLTQKDHYEQIIAGLTAQLAKAQEGRDGSTP